MLQNVKEMFSGLNIVDSEPGTLEDAKVFFKNAFAIKSEIERATEDGVFDINDLPGFFDELQDAPKTFRAALKLPSFFSTMSDEEGDQLGLYLGEKFNMDNDEVEVKVEATVKMVLSLVSYFNVMRGASDAAPIEEPVVNAAPKKKGGRKKNVEDNVQAKEETSENNEEN